ncbi:MAG: MFS transporter [Colwellia sp.]|nr:MFS transporter [Colwellia sp.]
MIDKDGYLKNIRKYQVYVLVSGFAFVGPLCNLFYLSADISFSKLSLIETASTVVLVFFEIPTGAIADLIGRKKSMALGCCLMGCEYIMIGAGYSFGFFIAAALIGGLGICLESGADDAILYDSLKKLNREGEFKKYLGQSNATFKISAAISGVVSSYLYSFDKSLIFYLCGFLLIGLGLYSLTMTETVSPPKPSANGKKNKPLKALVWRLLLKSYACLKGNKPLAWTILFAGLLTTTARANTALLRTPILANLLDDIFYLGFIVALGLGLSSIASWYADKILHFVNEQYILLIYAIGIGIVFIGIGCFNNLWIIVFIIPMYILNAFLSVFFSDYCHRHFNSKQRGTLNSFQEACRSFIGIFTLLGVGMMADTLGLQVSSISLGGAVLIGSILFIFFRLRKGCTLKSHDKLTCEH